MISDMIDNPPLIAHAIDLVHLSARLHILSFRCNGITIAIKIDEDNTERVVCKATDATGESIYFEAPVVEDELLLMKGVIQYAVTTFTSMAVIQKDYENVRVN